MTTSSQKPVPVEILLVEDSATDADLTLRSFRKGRCGNRIHHVKDGVEALAFLRREDGYEQAPAPDVLLLDLNLPRIFSRNHNRNFAVSLFGVAKMQS